MTATLELVGVSRTFGTGDAEVHALKDINLGVRSGELVAIMGPSGSGKSTLLRIAGTLDQATTGSATILGIDLNTCSYTTRAMLRRRAVGFVFQDFNLIPELSALDNVALPMELDGSRRRDAKAAARTALGRVGLAEVDSRSIGELSGGQRQRIAIARAIVNGHRLLLADEPTGSLDTQRGDEVMSLLRDLADDGVAVMVVTHSARHAGWADRVVFLRDGRHIDESTVDNDAVSLLSHGFVSDQL